MEDLKPIKKATKNYLRKSRKSNNKNTRSINTVQIRELVQDEIDRGLAIRDKYNHPRYSEIPALYATQKDVKGFIDADMYPGPAELRVLQSAVTDKVMSQITNTKFRLLSKNDKIHYLRMVLIDDFGDFAGKAAAILGKYAGKGAKLWKWLDANVISRIPAANQLKERVGEEFKHAYHIQNVTGVDDMMAMQSSNQTILHPMSEYSMTAISLDFVLSVLRPEDYRAQRPSQYGFKTSIAAGKAQFNLTVNEKGEAGFYFAPNNLVSLGSLLRPFLISVDQDDFNLTTGDGSRHYDSGPLFPQAVNIDSSMVGGLSLNVIPTLSQLNSQGKIELIYQQQSATKEIPQVISIGTADMQNLSNYQVRAARCDIPIRACRIPTINDITGFLTTELSATNFSPPLQEYFYIVLSGFPPSQGGDPPPPRTKVATIEISYCADYTPTVAVVTLAPPKIARPGLATLQAIESMFNLFPQVQSLSDQESQRFTAHVRGSQARCHDELLQACGRFFTNNVVTSGLKVFIGDQPSNLTNTSYVME